MDNAGIGIQGGNVLHGALMGLAVCGGGEAMLGVSRRWQGARGLDAAQLGIMAVVGGTIAELGGGNFANGAMTAAFAFLFNHVLHTNQLNRIKRLYQAYRRLNVLAANKLLPASDVCSRIGGEIAANCIKYGYEHVCAIRLSYAMNYAGMEIPEITSTNGFKYGTLKGGDGKNYLINAADMNLYISQTMDGSISVGNLHSSVINGIVYQNGFQNVSGHVDVVWQRKWATTGSSHNIPNNKSSITTIVYY